MPKITPKIPILPYYPEGSKDWEKRHLFDTDSIRQSPSGLERIDLKVYAIEAIRETAEQIQKQSYRRRMDKMNTLIERFHPKLWDSEHHIETEHQIVLEALPFYSEPYEDAMNVLRIPEYQKVPPAILEPTQQLHPTPPGQQHSISEQGIHLLDCDDPIKFFDAIFRPYEFRTILHQTNCTGFKRNLIYHHESRRSHRMKRSVASLALSYGHPLFNCPIVAATSQIRRYSTDHTSNSIPPVIDLKNYSRSCTSQAMRK